MSLLYRMKLRSATCPDSKVATEADERDAFLRAAVVFTPLDEDGDLRKPLGLSGDATPPGLSCEYEEVEKLLAQDSLDETFSLRDSIPEPQVVVIGYEDGDPRSTKALSTSAASAASNFRKISEQWMQGFDAMGDKFKAAVRPSMAPSRYRSAVVPRCEPKLSSTEESLRASNRRKRCDVCRFEAVPARRDLTGDFPDASLAYVSSIARPGPVQMP
mmetsp:Transcript_3574/g.14080  ORF Transcript_3574/g.14080 Transcript_3574/m.14080 type:complete len:216 (+) Transcript_3574:236-883(+)